MKIVYGAVDVPHLINTLKDNNVSAIMTTFDRPLSANGWRIAREYGLEVWLDSGAFSAWRKGKTIDIDAYAAYIQKHNPDVYFNLDVVGDTTKTLLNQSYLESIGLRPVPVFHLGEPMELLDELAGKYELIGLGGHVGKNPRSWFSECFARQKVNFHGLGVTRRIITEFPFASVDSSWWQAPIATGGGQNKIKEQERRINKLQNVKYRGYCYHQKGLF